MKAYHNIDYIEVLQRLCSSEQGLSEEEAQRRLVQYGPNELVEEEGEHWIISYLRQFTDPMLILLIISTIISIFIGQITDAIGIFFAIIVSSTFSFIQEYKAENAVKALKKHTSLNAKVIRNGKQKIIPAAEIVPGDIVVLETGDIVPADLRLIKVKNLKINESSLTGESIAVKKQIKPIDKDKVISERNNMAYMSTIVVYGRGLGVAVATGRNTHINTIAELLQEEKEDTPLQKEIHDLADKIGKISILMCVVFFSVGIAMGKDVFEMFRAAVVLAVAAIPEGLPTVLTITLGLGMRRMAKQKALIKRLIAVETLGCTSAICCDKTGTLTYNEMTVREIYNGNDTITVTGEGYSTEGKFYLKEKELDDNAIKKYIGKILLTGYLCNNSKVDIDCVIGDPTEICLKISAYKAGIDKNVKKQYKRIDEIPFDSERKYMAVICKTENNEEITFLKGAVDVVINLCDKIEINGEIKPLTDEIKERLLKKNDEMCSKALRVLAMAIGPGVNDVSDVKSFTFLGMQGMIDPPRKEVKYSLKECDAAGIEVKMITGDHKNTAIAIARELDMLHKKSIVLTGEEIDKLSDKELAEIIADIKICSRVSPEHKVRILKTLKAKGYIVAMTGDGVNDAPALKNANIGIAMSVTGTDVAKEASDMILLDDNFSTIVRAVREGRAIYKNIGKFLRFQLSTNVAATFIMFLTAVLPFFQQLPLLPVHLLWINILMDGPPALSLGFEKAPDSIMREKPRDPKSRILNRKMIISLFLNGIYICLGVLGMYYMALDPNIEFLNKGLPLGKIDIKRARTIAFTTFVFFEMFRVMTCRSAKESVFKIGFFSNIYLILAVATSVILQLLIIYTRFGSIFGVVPLSIPVLLKIIAVSSTIFIFSELYKLVILPLLSPENKAALKNISSA